jgi:N-acetyl sugar amidotransferase
LGLFENNVDIRTNLAINFCRRCLYGDSHPFGLTFDEDGICSGCRIHEEKNRLDWSARWKKLESITKQYKSNKQNQYDCIVPVSGGQDSYYIVHMVKKKLGLNPLLVTYNKYFNTELGIENLANLRMQFNCDILYQQVNPISVKKIVRTTLRKYGNIYWPILAGQTVFPVQVAVRYKIPLIIWGAHQGLEQVGMFSHEHEVEMTRRYRKEHDLFGIEADDLLSTFDVLTEQDIWQYRYPSDYNLHQQGIRGIYLGNYVRWDPKSQHEQMIEYYGYKTTSFDRTFDCYDYVDCFNYMGIHDLLKLYKQGYSKVTDHACREIRHGRLSREAALDLVQRYEQVEPKHIDLFCDWLGVQRLSLNFVMNQHRNRAFWRQEDPNSWSFNGWSVQQPKIQSAGANNSTAQPISTSFVLTGGNNDAVQQKYITFGKGWDERLPY